MEVLELEYSYRACNLLKIFTVDGNFNQSSSVILHIFFSQILPQVPCIIATDNSNAKARDAALSDTIERLVSKEQVLNVRIQNL